MSEYGWTIRYSLDVPLMQAFALYSAISARYGQKPAGPTYKDRAVIEAIRGASNPA